MGIALNNYSGATQTVQLSIQTDDTEYHSGNQPSHEVMKTWTFTAPTDCIVLGATLAATLKSSAADGAYIDLYASSLSSPIDSHNVQNATTTYARVGINVDYSPSSATTEQKLFVASGGTLTFQTRGTNGNAGDSVYVKLQKLTVYYQGV